MNFHHFPGEGIILSAPWNNKAANVTMVFSAQLPTASLIELCRALRHNLGAGLSLVKVFRQQALRGPVAVRPVAQRIGADLERGESLEAALREQKAAFPPLFTALAVVGERSGNLPEILGELEKYYVLQQKLWRRFVSQITWPVLQFFVAVFVLAGLIYILGVIADSHNQAAPDSLGLGLTGGGGALRFLLVVFGTLATVTILYQIVRRSLKQRAVVDQWLLRVPVLGPCLRALAMMRLCLALRLTLETGMTIMAAVRLGLRATGNQAFAVCADRIAERLRAGDDLTVALTGSGLFTENFLNIVAVAEESGRVPEVMKQQAEFYEEEAARRLRLLSQAAGFLVWLLVAGLIILAIFRIMNNMILPAYSM